MGLTSALQVGKSGLLASQTALQVTGNNLANLATEGFHRTDVSLSPTRARELSRGQFVGTGVQIQSLTRQVNEALEARLRGAVSDEAGSAQRQELLAQIESIENEFTDTDLSTRLTEFFNRWSELANNPQDMSLRTLVVEESGTLATFINDLRGEFGQLQKQTDDATGNAVSTLNDLLSQVAELNRKIAVQDKGTGGAGPLRDQRDILLSEISEYVDVSTIEQPSGSVDVFVGSIPLILGDTSRGVEMRRLVEDGQSSIEVIVADDGSPLDVSSGRIGALVDFRFDDLQDAIDQLDTFAGSLIYEVNRLHTQGQGLSLQTDVTGDYRVADTTVALNDADAALDFVPTHGSFQIHVTQKSTGQRDTQQISVDLDGLNGNDTSLDDLAAAINAVGNVTASVTSDGRLRVQSDSADFEVSFSNDSSGVLASLGIGGFFTGHNASNIGINETLRSDPRLVAAAQDHLPGDNRTALAILALRDGGVDALGGLSITQYWNRHVEDFAIRLSQAKASGEADAVIKANLQAQQQAYSGVNADEETVELLQYQRSFQASARFITVVDELMQTLISLA